MVYWVNVGIPAFHLYSVYVEMCRNSLVACPFYVEKYMQTLTDITWLIPSYLMVSLYI